ncbi:MAG TPA: lysine--tRNA ligase [Eubacteriales bacterium]|nr:lysine--tRNA ligase [Eubacteriales bacterium]
MTDQIKNEVTEELDLNEILRVRREKLAELIEKNENPFEKVKFDKTHFSAEIIENYEKLENQTVSVAGRIVSRRIMGKASFCNILDAQGTIQLYVSINDLGEDYDKFKTWDIGDIIGVTGFVFKTRMGEISVHVHKIELLSKSLLPLPEKFHGLKDTELRYRQRYVDLIANPEVKKTFYLRSKIISAIRNYLDGQGFIEVETPILSPLAGGANARPFITHHNTLGLDMYLRVAPELYLKRLIVGGFEKVYEIGRQFRNEGMDVRHNPEFTMMELYQAYADFHDMMDTVENIYKHVADVVMGTRTVICEGVEINLDRWEKLSMLEAVKKYCGVDFTNLTDEQAVAEAQKMGITMDKQKRTWGYALYEVFDQKVEENLVQPTFVYDYPVDVSPLAKKKPSDNRMTERFEFFILAREGGNAFSELNDPIDQESRFKQQAKQKAGGDEEALMTDDDYLTALQYGLPPTGGLGIGIDRMVMLFTDSHSIRDVLLFPTMKPLGK